ncbi:MAG: GNAT family N-acetyltransferase [Roseiflexaceae bacterium]
MAVSLRPAHPGDEALLAELIRAAFAEYRGVLDPPSSAERQSAERIGQEIADGGAWIALINQQPVGCVLWHKHIGYLYLDRLAVLPSARGHGVGRQLIDRVEALAKELGYRAVRLSVRLVLQQNIAYYQRLGYQQISSGTHAGYTSPTFGTFEKRLEYPL